MKLILFVFILLTFGEEPQNADDAAGGDGMEVAKKLFTELHGEIKEEKEKEKADDDEKAENCEAKKQDEQIYQAKQLSKIVLEDQIEKTKLRLTDVTKKIQALKYNMPTNEKSDDCLDLTNCAACTKNIKCGWCAMEERCIAGDNIGPLYTMCNFYNYLYCAGDCARFVDCESCTKNKGCGWCEDQAHMVIGCIEIESDGIQCPPSYLFGEGTDSCPQRKIEIVKTYEGKKKKRKEAKAEDPNKKSAERGWEDSYVAVRQSRYKQRIESLKSNGNAAGQSASQSELDNLYEEKGTLTQKLNKYQKQYKKLVAENEGEDEGE